MNTGNPNPLSLKMVQNSRIGFWEFLSSRPSSFRAVLVFLVAWMLAATTFFFMRALYNASNLYQEYAWAVARGELDPKVIYGFAPDFTIVIAFLILPWFILHWILVRFVLNKEDLSYFTSTANQRLERLYRLQLGHKRTLIALMLGITATILFDWHVASTVLSTPIGQLARSLSDAVVLLSGSSLAAMLMFGNSRTSG